MFALVVYESMWGNTKAVAEAVAEGLSEHLTVDLVDVGAAPELASVTADLLVVGAPTHAFGLSQPATREDAHQHGGDDVPSGVREWIDRAPELNLTVATFDTHVRHPNLPGHAGRSAAKRLRKLGCTEASRPESFFVDGKEGPLLPGELERARMWGTELARQLTP